MKTSQVFISHTSDMALFPEVRSFVQAAMDAVDRAGMAAVDMRSFAARDGEPAEYCRRRVRECEIYVGVIGFRYGSLVPRELVSYTELEFIEAGLADLPRLVFLMAETAGLPADLADEDRSAVQAFRERLLNAGLIVRVFTSDTSLELEVFHALTEAAGGGPRAVPRQLPAVASHFAGRTAELAALDDLVRERGRAGDPVVISAIGGTAGVGKTALAVRWAHQVGHLFPDGQLYVDLRGFGPEPPVRAEDALDGFLRALGMPGQEIPAGADERAAAYRSLIAGRRALVLLDNAASAEQVRPLLPGSGSCAVVVTSRVSMGALVALNGARHLEIDVLPLTDAVSLLRSLIGAKVDADLGSAVTLAAQCDRLPLALRVVAELAVARPVSSLAELAGELADEQRRLDLLDAGDDPRTAVRAVFSWSYRQLGDDAARTFRLLGLHPGPDFDVYAAAVLTGAERESARRTLALLVRAHLISPTSADRYRMHDLLRVYAASQAYHHDTDDDRRAALTRLFDRYLALAGAAMDALIPAERHRRPRIEVPAQPVPGPALTDAGEGRAWLDAHLATLTAMAVYTAAHGWPSHTTRLSSTVWRYLDNGGHYSEAITIATKAHFAARQTGDLPGQARALNNLGLVDWQQGRYRQANDELLEALALFGQTGDQVGEALTHSNLGLVAWQQGRYPQATDHHQQAVAALHRIGDSVGEARSLGNLAVVYERLGRYQEATERLQEALTLFRHMDDLHGEAYTLINLGSVKERLGDYQQATDHLEQALALLRPVGDRYGAPYALAGLGAVEKQQGRHQQAIGHLEQALDLHRESGDRPGAAEALNNLGEVYLAAGQPDDARAQHDTALDLAAQIGDRYQQARAHDGLAAAHRAGGNTELARAHWQEALSLYQALTVPQAEVVQAHLTTLGRTAADSGTGQPMNPTGV
jgi:tetratricopeptide (TPR) repeat protein